jgi:hypothetical protein
MWAYIIEFFVHIPMAYLIISVYKLGLLGLALLTSLDYLLRFSFL